MRFCPTWTWRFLPCALLCLTGCGGVGNVSGKVTVGGKPVTFGRLSFVCTTGKKPVFSCNIRDGVYALSGVPTGPVQIAVESFKLKKTRFQPPSGKKVRISPPLDPSAGPETIEPPPPETLPSVTAPARYANAESSGLTYTVIKGDQVHDVPLEP